MSLFVLPLLLPVSNLNFRLAGLSAGLGGVGIGGIVGERGVSEVLLSWDNKGLLCLVTLQKREGIRLFHTHGRTIVNQKLCRTLAERVSRQ